ncbi:MAG: TauD/TfdA dioxygenase family protein [Hyphomicrobiaceae bacterium]
MPVEAIPLTAHIGAEIRGVDLSKPVDAETANELNSLWLKHIVLLFRDQHLSQEALVKATGVFGKLANLARPAEFRPAGYDKLLDNIMLISNIRENGEPIGALPDGEMWFHHDMLHAEVPHKGTCLYSVEVPSQGGNTLFANCYRAYETLPESLKQKLDGKRASHSYTLGEQQRGDGKGVKHVRRSTHPVFRTHEETGRKAVFINRLMTEAIDGLDEAEGSALIKAVCDHSENPEWVYEHVWQPNDLLLWDNRCSMHARTDFPAGERRLMLRTTIEGTVAPM